MDKERTQKIKIMIMNTINYKGKSIKNLTHSEKIECIEYLIKENDKLEKFVKKIKFNISRKLKFDTISLRSDWFAYTEDFKKFARKNKMLINIDKHPRYDPYKEYDHMTDKKIRGSYSDEYMIKNINCNGYICFEKEKGFYFKIEINDEEIKYKIDDYNTFTILVLEMNNEK